MKKKLPVGIDRFEKIRREGFYYVDKTMFIENLLSSWGEANLFTRPRRFGKSLTMSMLKAFFEIGGDRTLFDGLAIAKRQDLCDAYMGQFPVICVTLKDVDGSDFETARCRLSEIVGTEADRFSFLAESGRLTRNEKDRYKAIVRLKNGRYTMDDVVLASSLKVLSGLLSRHYGKKTIILIDEYDVPLEKAFQMGYYDDMIRLIRGLFSSALKSNESLQFAVLTGCLRIGRESIFTGMNNPKIHTIADSRYDEYFGFTETDVKNLLEYYGLSERYPDVKEWYDGYRFGNMEVYCPWDVVNFCDDACVDAEVKPKNYWANTSSNNLVRRFIDKASRQTKEDIERLIAGETIVKAVNQELTYSDIDRSVENLWSVLFTTGYLTQRRRVDERRFELAIPNREIRNLFISQIQEWFRDTAREDRRGLEMLCAAFLKPDAALVQKLLNDYLWNSISIRDTAARKEKKENFYHGFLLGLLQYEESWIIRSNVEAGEGYSDILIETPDRTGVVVELKYAGSNNLEKECREALDQIDRKQYAARLADDGMERTVKYGIAFYKKQCRVLAEIDK